MDGRDKGVCLSILMVFAFVEISVEKEVYLVGADGAQREPTEIWLKERSELQNNPFVAIADV